MCNCPAHHELVDCDGCHCDHGNERMLQWKSRALAVETELARLRAGEDATPRDPVCQPTPGQWIRRFNDASAEQRLTMARIVLDNSERAARCFEMDHDGLLEWAEYTRTRGWWNWRIAQWWWWKQYRRRDRKAFRRECAEIQDRAGESA